MRTPSITALVLFTALLVRESEAQIPAARNYQWDHAGMIHPLPTIANSYDVMDHGADSTGTLPSDAAIAAILAMPGTQRIIFPAGTFLFTSQWLLPDSVSIEGSGAGSTHLVFDLGGLNDCIRAAGYGGFTSALVQPAIKGDTIIRVEHPEYFVVQDLARIIVDDTLLVTSTWAPGNVGQLELVEAISGDTLFLRSALRIDLDPGTRVTRLHPRRGISISCLSIQRLDVTADKYSNIQFMNAMDCSVTGVESEDCNYAHITLENATNIEIRDCHFHHAHAYGDNGHAFGVCTQVTSGENLVENNVFEHLRHAMICQVGVNGNVFAYNYSFDPFWSQFPFPSNASGDIVLHGDYPFANLFEGNIVQNIVIDDSHGRNGPDNCFFRNRAGLYGFVMNNNPPSDGQIFIGNEITNTGAPPLGLYLLYGTGHFEHGNNDNGTVIPAGTASLTDTSLYRSSRPAFLPPWLWPALADPIAYNTGTNQAKERTLDGMPVICADEDYEWVTTGSADPPVQRSKLYPNPASDRVWLTVPEGWVIDRKELRQGDGRIIRVWSTGDAMIDLGGIPTGAYQVRIIARDGAIATGKLLILR